MNKDVKDMTIRELSKAILESKMRYIDTDRELDALIEKVPTSSVRVQTKELQFLLPQIRAQEAHYTRLYDIAYTELKNMGLLASAPVVAAVNPIVKEAQDSRHSDLLCAASLVYRLFGGMAKPTMEHYDAMVTLGEVLRYYDESVPMQEEPTLPFEENDEDKEGI